MPFLQPAVRVRQAKRHPVDVRMGRGPPKVVSPGAGSGNPHLYDHELNSGQGGPTPGPPVPPTVVANVAAPSIGNNPTSTSLGVSTLTTTPLSSGVSSSSGAVPSSIPLTASDIILSSPSSSSSPVSTPTPTAATSSVVPQSPISGSTTTPAKGGVTSSVPADSDQVGATNNTSRPPGGIIAAIVIVLLLALCAVAFFVWRRHRIQKRVARRVTWTANLSPRTNFDASLEKGVVHVHTVDPVETASQLSKEGGNEQEKVVQPVRNIARKPPLPYSPVSPAAPSPTRSHSSTPDTRAPSMESANASTIPSTPVPDVPTFVRMTFIPQLPDELAITPGETLHIRTEFDDGWALCINSSGEQGMVPLECLEGGGGRFAGRSQLRTMRRASSLNSATTWS